MLNRENLFFCEDKAEKRNQINTISLAFATS